MDWMQAWLDERETLKRQAEMQDRAAQDAIPVKLRNNHLEEAARIRRELRAFELGGPGPEETRHEKMRRGWEVLMAEERAR